MFPEELFNVNKRRYKNRPPLPAKFVATLLLTICPNILLAGDCVYEGCDTSGRKDNWLNFSGWVMQGFTWNPDSPADRFNGPVSQNDRANEYQLNQVYLSAVVPTTAVTDSFSAGIQADVLFGTDAFFFHSLGLDDRIVSDRSSRFYKLAIPQIYGEFGTTAGDTDVTFQVGKWFALVGYESGLESDFFYSRTIGFNPTPYSHTGILATIDLSDNVSVSHGLHRGSDVFEDNNNNLGYTGLVNWSPADSATSITLATNIGPEQDERTDWQDIDGNSGADSPGRNLNRVVCSATLESQLADNVEYVCNFDYLYQHGSVQYAVPNAEGYGITQYLIYRPQEKLGAGLRLEIYRDDDGFVNSGFRSGNPAAPGLYTNLTAGLEWTPTDCVIIRPEIRWDWQDRDSAASTPAYRSGTTNRQFLCALSAVLRF